MQQRSVPCKVLCRCEGSGLGLMHAAFKTERKFSMARRRREVKPAQTGGLRVRAGGRGNAAKAALELGGPVRD